MTYLFYLLLYCVATLLVILIACAFGFRYFLVNDPAVYASAHRRRLLLVDTRLTDSARAVFFFIWGNAMIAMSFLLSHMFRLARTAVIVG